MRVRLSRTASELFRSNPSFDCEITVQVSRHWNLIVCHILAVALGQHPYESEDQSRYCPEKRSRHRVESLQCEVPAFKCVEALEICFF